MSVAARPLTGYNTVMDIRFSIGSLQMEAKLNDSSTARLIASRLPFDAKAELWGKEVYFYIGPKVELEPAYAADVVEAGDVAYWPQGPCLCLFFGPTPSSRDGKIMPASAVTVLGRLTGEIKQLEKVKDGDSVKVERV